MIADVNARSQGNRNHGIDLSLVQLANLGIVNFSDALMFNSNAVLVFQMFSTSYV